MVALGFAQEWVELVMLCVTTVQYSLLVNGDVVGVVTLTRDIGQGDSLSPYLFIIYVKGLSNVL